MKPVALVFFPLAFSSSLHGRAVRAARQPRSVRGHGVELIGISVDSKATLRAWAEQEGYDFTLLADFWPHGEVAKEYGVFLEEKGFANRATFVIEARASSARASQLQGEARSLEGYRAALAAL